jgi:hypothetical protein
VAGAATLVSVGWGLKDQGLYCVAVMLAALIAARSLAGDRPGTTQRACAASQHEVGGAEAAPHPRAVP